MSDEPAFPTTSTGHRYDVAPYQPPGSFAGPRLLLGVVALGLIAAGLGYLLHWLDRWLPDIEWAWALGLGFGAGLLGSLTVYAVRLRHIPLAILYGLLTGAFSLVFMHFWNYRDALPEIDNRARRWAAATVAYEILVRDVIIGPRPQPPTALQAKLPPSLPEALLPIIRAQVEAGKMDRAFQGGAAKILAQPNEDVPDLGEPINQALRDALAAFGFPQYLDWKARQGVPLSLPRVPRMMTLSYFWSWTYWAVELLVTGGISAYFFYVAARIPACSECGAWLGERPLGRLNLEPQRADAVFSTGTVMDLAGEDLAMPEGPILLKVWVCPNCGDEASITVQALHVTKKVGEEDKEEQHELTEILVYPGSALAVLEALTTASPAAEEPPAQEEVPRPASAP